jgi:F0F1-type ATP synthase assembly protein I
LETTGRTGRGGFTDAVARLVPTTAPPTVGDPATDPGASTEVARARAAATAERRALTNGFGDALAKAFEMAATPAIFGFLGWLLDRWLGTEPLFLVAFVVIVFVYEVWKMFQGYGAAMAEHEAKLTGKRPGASDPS